MALLELDKTSETQSGHDDVEPLAANRASTEFRRFRLYVFLLLVDSFCIVAPFCLAGLLRSSKLLGGAGLHIAGMVAPIYLFLALNSNAYSYAVLLDWKRGLAKAVGAFGLSISAILFVAFYSRSSLEFSRLVYGVGTALAFVALVYLAIAN